MVELKKSSPTMKKEFGGFKDPGPWAAVSFARSTECPVQQLSILDFSVEGLT